MIDFSIPLCSQRGSMLIQCSVIADPSAYSDQCSILSVKTPTIHLL